MLYAKHRVPDPRQPDHHRRVRLSGITIWRLQCTTCRAVFTVLPYFVLRYRQMHPEVTRNALLATHRGLSLELCAIIYHISPMALYRLVCAFCCASHKSRSRGRSQAQVVLQQNQLRYVVPRPAHLPCTTRAAFRW